MKKLSLSLLLLLFTVSCFADEILSIKLFDGEMIKGKLWLPKNESSIKEVIIFVHGTGPNTFLNHRKAAGVEFDYYGMFGDEFAKRGVAFFSYNRRGVDTSGKPPYETIDRRKYDKYTPYNEAKDVSSIIKSIRKDKRLKNAKIILLGWSEGTIIASMVAENKKNKVAALFLAGYVHERMDAVITWQNSGESSMVLLLNYFDSDSSKTISRTEYESTTRKATTGSAAMRNAKFEQLDINKDSLITIEDFKTLLAPRNKAIFDAFEKKDGEWIWNNYFKVTIGWMKEHLELTPNKVRLLSVNIPIYIFHGDIDMNCSVEGVYDLAARFKEKGKTNLKYYVFKNHSHDLNFFDWLIKKETPEGITKIFSVAEELNK